MSALHFFVEGGVRGVEDRFAGGLMATAQYHQLPFVISRTIMYRKRSEDESCRRRSRPCNSAPLRKKICLLRDASKLHGAIYLPECQSKKYY